MTTDTYKSMWFESVGDVEKIGEYPINKSMFMVKISKDCTTLEIIRYSANKPISSGDIYKCENIVPQSIAWIMEQYMGIKKEERVKRFYPVKFYSGDERCVDQCTKKYYAKTLQGITKWGECVDKCPNKDNKLSSLPPPMVPSFLQ